MATINAIAVALALITNVASPVMALAIPCCCAKRATSERACCKKVDGQATPHHKACCAKKLAASEAALPTSGCCCFKAPITATTCPENPVAPPAEILAGEYTGFHPTNVAVQLVPIAGLTLSGPPLLALYCTWLK